MDDIDQTMDFIKALDVINRNLKYCYSILKVQHEHLLEQLENMNGNKKPKIKEQEYDKANMVFVPGLGYYPKEKTESKRISKDEPDLINE